MVLVDTSVWVDLFRDASSSTRNNLAREVGDHEVVLSRFQQLELLQGCRDEHEWSLLGSYLDTQEYLEMSVSSWSDAARTFYDLRRVGLTVRSPLDCCIAQIALDHDILLIHRDHDFETISQIRPLRQLWLEADGSSVGLST